MRTVFKTILILLLLQWYGMFSDVLARADDSYFPVATIVLEAGNQSLEGQIAVGEVIRNRAKTHNTSPTHVVLKANQFSCWNNREQALKRLKMENAGVWQKASRAWALSEDSNLTGGATHYYAYYVKPYWAKNLKNKKTIGWHIFGATD